MGVLVLGRRPSRAERATREHKVERSALMARDADVGETDGHGAELTEPVLRPTAGKLSAELSVVAITKATEARAPMRCARWGRRFLVVEALVFHVLGTCFSGDPRRYAGVRSFPSSDRPVLRACRTTWP